MHRERSYVVAALCFTGAIAGVEPVWARCQVELGWHPGDVHLGNATSFTGDLNADGFRHDRPLGVERNSGTTPPTFNLDLRYSRFFPIGSSMRLEAFTEFTNVLNVSSIVQFNNVSVPTNSDGELSGGLPDFRARNQSTFQESRQLQLGVRFFF